MPEPLFRNKYRVPSARLAQLQYHLPGWFFITIVTKKRHTAFGTLMNGRIEFSPLGKIASGFWSEIPVHFPNMSTDAFVVMPDHLHGLLAINAADDSVVETLHATSLPLTPKDQAMPAVGPKAGGISAAVRSYKSAVTRWARGNGFSEFAWQERYWDTVVRGEADLNRMREYIRDNPLRAHGVDDQGRDED